MKLMEADFNKSHPCYFENKGKHRRYKGNL